MHNSVSDPLHFDAAPEALCIMLFFQQKMSSKFHVLTNPAKTFPHYYHPLLRIFIFQMNKK